MESDETLVAHAAADNHEAFEELLRRHHGRIYRLARGLTRGNDAAEDLTQETFIRAYRAIAGFRGDSSFSAWLHRIAVNVIRSHFTRRRFRADAPLANEDGGGTSLATDLACPHDPESTIVQRHMIDQALSTLSPQARCVIALRDVRGLEYHEIAALLRIPIGTVESRIFRARRKLRPLLAPLITRTKATWQA